MRAGGLRKQQYAEPVAFGLTAHLCCAAALAVGAAGASSSAGAATGDVQVAALQLAVNEFLIIAVLAGVIMVAAATGYAFLRAAARARRAENLIQSKAEVLRKELSCANTLLKSENQAVIVWEQGKQQGRLPVYTLDPACGVPQSLRKILRFATWLERDGAIEFEKHVNELKNNGTPFSCVLRTANGAFLEAEGRPAGDLVVVRLRDIQEHGFDRVHLITRVRALEEEISAHKALLEALPVPVWFRDADDELVWVNQAYISAVDAADLDEVIKRQIELFEARQRSAIRKAVSAGSIFRQRIQTIVGGERRSYEAIAVPIERTAAGAAIDVAPLESAQGELDRQMAAHARTLDKVASAIAIFATDRRLTFYNQAFVELWKLQPSWLDERPTLGEILDRLRSARLLPEQADYRGWRARQLAIFEDADQSDLHEDWWHLPDGRTIHVAADQRPDGGVTFLYDDVTEKLDLESRYNALIDVQRETLDHLREGVAVFGSDGRLRLYNPAFGEIWKLPDDFLKTEPHVDDVIRRSSKMVEDSEPWELVRHAVTGVYDQRKAFEGQLERVDGNIIAYAGVPLPDGATMLTYVDITDSKRVEWALIERNEALEASDRLKNAFISHVSYELRTPLTNIIGFAELLGDPHFGTLNPKQRDYLDDIRASSQTLLAIINDILDLATIDAGALELKLASVDVREIIKAAELGVRERLHSSNLRLETEIAPGIDKIVADDKRVTQILYNLLSNAIGFSQEGGTITLSCRRVDNMIAFSVQDTGCGIPEEYQDSVFQRFESHPRGSKHRGAGLGLSIVKSLVELHGGEIQLRSAPGAGTTVTVLLPVEGPRRTVHSNGGTGTGEPAETNWQDGDVRAGRDISATVAR